MSVGASKGRFDGLDVQAMVSFLQLSFLGRRVVNIYDGDTGETYIFKLEGESSKEFLLIESGIRFHTLANFQAEASSMPSPFAAKLRKHIRGLRLEQIQQIGSDRVVLFQFGSGPSKHSIILELYAKGNLILTDKDYTVLALLRSHLYNTNNNNEESKSESVAVQVGNVYPVTYATSLAKKETATDQKEGENSEASHGSVLSMNSYEDFNEWVLQHVRNTVANLSNATKKKKKQQQASLTLKMMLLQKHDSGVMHYGPALIEHCILSANLDPHRNLAEYAKQNDSEKVIIWSEKEWNDLRQAFQNEAPKVLQMLTTQSAGYILYHPREQEVTDPDGAKVKRADANADKIYQEFLPVLMKQHESRLHIKFDNFALAVEEYFDRLQHQKNIQRAAAAEKAAANKLEKVRADQQVRLDNLYAQQEVLHQEAATVQLHADNVDKALAVINSALDSGMDWEQLEQVVQVEQEQNRNPIALLIEKLELENDTMVLRLPTDSTDISNIDDNTSTISVRISLKESAFSNANELFSKYRASKDKAEKTIEASTKALRAAEETAKRQLAEAQKRSKQTVVDVKRKPSWFEKFHWFITSDNYIVIGGRDAHQNELLVKRYLRPGDAYLHADVHGASSCILRAKRRRKSDGSTEVIPLSEQALREAGNFTICRSSAWTSRMVTSAWWVESHQVSKTAPSGEYLTVGSFMIRGKKNFLPPTPLEMGLAVLFRLGDEDSIIRHKNERRDFALLELENDDFDDFDKPDTRNDKPSSTGHEETKLENEEKSEVSDPGHIENDESESESNSVQENGQNNTEEISADESDAEENKNKDSNDENENAEEDNDADTNTKSKRRGLSARDRRLIKKYGSLEAAEKAAEQRKEDEAATINKSTKEEVAANSPSTNTGKASKRGKRGKQKKVMTKYADQDEEDRELALQALQGGEKSKKKKKTKQGKGKGVNAQKQEIVAAETKALLLKDSAAAAEKVDSEVRSVLAECVTVKNTEDDSVIVRWDKFDADTLEQISGLEPVAAQMAAAKRLLHLKRTTRVDNFSASLGGIIRAIRKHGYESMLNNNGGGDAGKRKTKQQKEEEASKWKKELEAEGVADSDLDDDAVDDTVEVGKLTGKPHPDDLLVFAIPVCAPYQTLSQYNYRVKLTPGNMKRGKSSKQCIDIFLKSSSEKKSAAIDRQLEFIRKIPENDWIQVICADVKISAAGASKTAKKVKAGKKGKK